VALAQSTTRISVSSSGVEANGYSIDSRISGDGKTIVFTSSATNLVGADTNAANDVFVHDRLSAATVRVSVDSTGLEGDRNSYQSAVSRDGRHVAFVSDATNLVSGDTNDEPDVFVHDRLSGTTVRVSVSSSLAEGDDDSVSRVREFEQRRPAPHGHGRAQRELMRRRHTDHVRIGGQPLHDHSFAIDRHWRDPRTSGRERRAQGGVTGVFDRDHGAPGGDQDPGEQIEGLLRTRCDDDVARPTGNRAGERNMLCDGRAQCLPPVRPGIGRRLGGERAQRPCQ
jgi:hypothetical protein